MKKKIDNTRKFGIPAEAMRLLHIEKGDYLDICIDEEESSIVLRKSQNQEDQQRLTLHELKIKMRKMMDGGIELKDKVEAKKLMMKFFPSWRTYPKNSMTPIVIDSPNKADTIIGFLVLADKDIDDELSKEFKDLDFNIYTEPNANGKDTDIVIALTKKNLLHGDIKLESVIYGDDKIAQISFCRAFKRVDEFFLFTSNNEGVASSVKEFGFDHNDFPTIDKILA